MVKKAISIGTDIGGSHISCAAIDLEKKSIIRSSFSENKVNNKGTEDEILNSWGIALRNCLSKIPADQLKGIGFAIPGPFDYENGIALFEGANNKYEKLNKVDIGKRLKDLLKLDDSVAIRFMNDASSFAVGEAWMGKSSGYRKSLAITLGTGFGSAFIDDGIPVVQGENVPDSGCVWHLKFKKSIADDYISSRWFTDTYEGKTKKKVSGVKDLVELIHTEPFVADLFEEYGNNLAVILHPWIGKFGVEIVVMGGNISGAYSLFGPHFENALKVKGLSPVVKISELKEEAAIIGSARLMEDDFWNSIKPILKFM